MSVNDKPIPPHIWILVRHPFLVCNRDYPPHIADSQSRENPPSPGAFFSHARRFIVAGGNFNNITNITHPIPESDPTEIPICQSDLLHEERLMSKIMLFNTKWERGSEKCTQCGCKAGETGEEAPKFSATLCDIQIVGSTSHDLPQW
ncbi:hypothetical protein B0H14DRAFT_2593751 [Mycena olivaceomarginata]|nr:hypothetical protein B0H14DRAFT_2593751 [Mycena olivaceomarginata]